MSSGFNRAYLPGLGFREEPTLDQYRATVAFLTRSGRDAPPAMRADFERLIRMKEFADKANPPETRTIR